MSTENKPQPFLKWIGGKRQLMSHIIAESPSEGYTRLVEPFVGGGSVFMSLTPDKIHINDSNTELTTTYLVIRDNLDELLNKLEQLSHMNSKEEYYQIRSCTPHLINRADKVHQAARMIYLNKTCFNGLYRVNKSGEFNSPYGYYKNPKILDRENLRNVSEYLNNSQAKITNTDYSHVLQECHPGDFVYLDPPYDYEEGQKGFVGYTGSGFTKENHVDVYNELVRLNNNGVKWLYSNNSTRFINNLFKDFKITTVMANRNVNSNGSGRGKVPEVLIKNY